MKKLLFSLAVAVIALASCQKDMDVLNNKGDQMNKISLRAVNGLTKSAIDGTTFPDGYKMRVSAYRNLDAQHSGDDEAENFFTDIRFTKDGTVWKAGKYWPVSGNLDFLALSCNNLESLTNVTFDADTCARRVALDVPDNSITFDDLLFGSSNAQTYNSDGNPISFKHAMAAVVFTAKSNVPYDADTNVGITIDSIAVNGAKYSGTLTVENPAAAGNSGTLSATWSALGDSHDYVRARVWNAANLGTNNAETQLTALHLVDTSATIANHPFGDGYVILPEQTNRPFTVYYTLHNGKDNGGANINNHIQYKYEPDTGTWEQSKKYIYDIQFKLDEITIAPSIAPWTDQTVVNVPVNQ